MLEYVQTDIWVRFQRHIGNTCHYVCADDAHGTAIMLRAEQEGITPEQLIANVQAEHEQDFKDFQVSFDNFYSTHSPENKDFSEYIYKACEAKGHIASRTITQAFDPEKQLFLADRYVTGECPKCSAQNQYGDGCDSCGVTYSATELVNPKSTLTGSTPTHKISEHVFFNLEKSKDLLKQFLKTVQMQKPIVSKLSEWLDGDLKSWDISRDEPYFGFSIPEENNKYFYVWVDAPIGYLASATNWADRNHTNLESLWGKDSV